MVGPHSSVPAALIVPLSLCVSCEMSDVSYGRSKFLGEIIASWGEVPKVKGSKVSLGFTLDISLLVADVLLLICWVAYFA